MLMQFLLLVVSSLAVFAQASNTSLGAAAKNGDIEKVTAAIKCGAKVNGPMDENERTPLMWASAYGHLKVVEVLVQAGARINDKDYRGGTALTYARAGAHDNVIKFLESKGAVAPKMTELDTAMWLLGQGKELFEYFGKRAIDPKEKKE